MSKILNSSTFQNRAAAVLGGPRTSFLDHLAPLCDLFNIPLICTDSWVYTTAKTFYPSTLSVFLANEKTFQEMLNGYEILFTVQPCRLHPRALQFGEFLYKGDAKTIAGFHGNSDKYRNTFWIERYADEDCVLLYGQHYVDFFAEKGALKCIRKKAFIGNIRLHYYLKYKAFFDEVLKKLLPKIETKKKILYAPTWSFSGIEDDGTFFENYELLVKNVPEDISLIIKLHPYYFRLFPAKMEKIKEECMACERIVFLDEIPLVYPFLAQADYYLGDYSSVGYDFLAFNRPLFFLTNKEERIHPAGRVIEDVGEFYQFLDQFQESSSQAKKRSEIYNYSFAAVDLDEVKKEIESFFP